MSHFKAWSFAILLALLPALTVQDARGETDMSAPLTGRLAVLTCPDSGEGVWLLFELANTLDRPVWVLTWNTPLEGLWNDILRVERGGTTVPYEGPMAKRGTPSPADYLLIPPMGKTRAAIDLSAAFDLTGAGPYTVAFNGLVHDVMIAASTEDGDEAPPFDQVTIDGRTHGGQWASMTVPTAAVTFRIGPDPTPPSGD